MNHALCAEPLIASDFDALINGTLAGVSDAHNMVCGPDIAWLAELHEVLPDLDPSEARLITLLLIVSKRRLIGERAFDLMAEQRRADPSLGELMDDLLVADDGNELPDQHHA
jgi:hypothetical protein